MKSLKKMKLINWHYFWNQTIEFQPLVFLTGLNGSGKSTLIDAMQVLLLGDTSGRFFNKAATEKSSRTLKGYLKCELGDAEDGGFRYLRNGRFTSYIAMEFYDDINKSSFTFGIVFDVFPDGGVDHRFFCLDDKIPENEFIVDDTPLDFKQLSAYFAENYPGKFKFLDSNKQYQELLKRRFGGLKEKYFSLFKKAVSFTPITDIETFITEYICDSQANINISSMQENILQYKKLQNEANVMANRIQRLTEISNAYIQHQQQKESETLFSYIVEKADYENDLARIKTYKVAIEDAQKRLRDIESDLVYNDDQIKILTKKKEQLISDKLNNDTYKLTDDLWEEKKKYEESLARIEKDKNITIENLNKYATSYLETAQLISSTLSTFDLTLIEKEHLDDINKLIELSSEVIEKCLEFKNVYLVNIESLTSFALNEWRQLLESFKQTISGFNFNLSKIVAATEQKAAVLRQQEVDMRNGGKSYERGLVYLRNELMSELSRRYNKKIDVYIYADLVDINDEKWGKAIEGFLYNQKFNLFVDPLYYAEAHDILKNLMRSCNYYHTSLVDQQKVIERNFICESGSLAEEIITDHQGARAYTNFLLGRLIKCDTVKQARNSGNGITMDCDLYRNFTLSVIQPQLYQTAYIGRRVGEEQILAKHKAVEDCRKLCDSYRSLHDIISEANELEVINTYEVNNSMALIENASNIKAIKENLKFIEEELNKHDLTQIQSYEQRISDITEDLEQLAKEKEDLLIEKGNLISQIKNYQEEKLPKEQCAANERLERLENMYDGFFIDEIGNVEYQKLVDQGKTTIEIVTETKVNLSKAQYLANSSKSAVIRLRKDYIKDYRLSYDVDSDDNDVYDNELNEMRDIKLPQYQLAIDDAYNKATKQFKDDFINKLRTAIETVESQIDELNVALASSTFGNDSYRFLVRPSVEYRKYYDMIKDDLLLQVGEDDSAFVEKYKDVMDDLFRQIVDVGGHDERQSAIIANVEKFTDYRSYLDFDIVVTNKDGIEQHLSKTIKKKSGGETQTPSYIAVLASFAQLYRVNEPGELGNSFRLIIFDEAFSKMDRGRIKESIRLLSKFGLQVILSAPSDKVGDISELVDETLVVLHDKSSSSVRLYAEEKKLLN